MKRFIPVFLTFLIVLLTSFVNVKADEPLPPPADYWISSQNNKFKAFFDVKNNLTTVYKSEKSGRKVKNSKIWQMQGWYRNTFLSNDGENLIVVYDGANLLDLDYKVTQVMITFYDQGKNIKEIKLNELIENPTPEKLEKTVSHYKWVYTYGLNSKQLFEVNTIEKKQFLFDIKTGLPIGTSLYQSENNNQMLPTEKPEISNSENTVNKNSNSEAVKENENKVKNGCQMTVLFLTFISFYASKTAKFSITK